jgi:uncharacterized protein (DUF3084 family)
VTIENDVLNVKLDTVQQDLKDLKGEMTALRQDLKPALDMLTRHDERLQALQSWRNGTVASLVALGVAMFKQKLGF